MKNSDKNIHNVEKSKHTEKVFFMKTMKGIFESVLIVLYFLGLFMKIAGEKQNKKGEISSVASWGRGLEKTASLRIISLFNLVRLITKNDGVNTVVNSLIKSLPSISKLVVVELLFFFILGLINVNFFKGTFHYCDKKNATLPEGFEIVT
jgi:Ion transport protein